MRIAPGASERKQILPPHGIKEPPLQNSVLLSCTDLCGKCIFTKHMNVNFLKLSFIISPMLFKDLGLHISDYFGDSLLYPVLNTVKAKFFEQVLATFLFPVIAIVRGSSESEFQSCNFTLGPCHIRPLQKPPFKMCNRSILFSL